MTPGALQRARKWSAARVSGALGVSVALHVLAAVALWRGASEPEPVGVDRPLPVELVWREAVRPGAVRPASPGRVRKQSAPPSPKAPAQVEAGAPAPLPSPVVAPSEPVLGDAPREGGESLALGPEGGSERGAVGPGTLGDSPAGGGGTEARGDSELRAYREQLSRSVTRGLRYPSQAVRLRLEGTARVLVRINRDGSLAGPPRLEGSSRFRVLDLEALRVVEASAPFSPLPPELSRESVEFVIPVSFSLRAAAG